MQYLVGMDWATFLKKAKKAKIKLLFDWRSLFHIDSLKFISYKVSTNNRIDQIKWTDTIFTEWKFQNLSAIQNLREINFWNCKSPKNCHFDIFVTLKFDFVDVLRCFRAEIDQKQNSEPLKLQKRQFLNHFNLQIWFHVKSEGHKSSKFSTMCLWKRSKLSSNQLYC